MTVLELVERQASSARPNTVVSPRMVRTDSPIRASRPGRLDINPTGVPYWWDAAPPGEDLAGELPSSADVVVIGAGWTGLSAALTLARAGREVLVLDANAPGTGASTRNAGYFGSQLRASLRALIHRYGESTALDLARVAEQGFAFSKDLIETEQIQCDLQDLGRLTCAARPAHYETMARDAELSHRVLGVECQILTAAELRRELGTDQYYGGEFRPSAWCMHPGKYVSGLLDRVRSAGATVRGGTLVTGLDRRDKRVITERGRVTARNVLVATNAYTGEFIPELKRRLIPFGANVIATEELDEAILRAVFPRPRLGIDTRRLYRRFDPRRMAAESCSRDARGIPVAAPSTTVRCCADSWWSCSPSCRASPSPTPGAATWDSRSTTCPISASMTVFTTRWGSMEQARPWRPISATRLRSPSSASGTPMVCSTASSSSHVLSTTVSPGSCPGCSPTTSLLDRVGR